MKKEGVALKVITKKCACGDKCVCKNGDNGETPIEGVYKYLDCSTIHVKPKDLALCGADEIGSSGVIAYENEYGAWVCVPHEIELSPIQAEIRREGFSKEFVNVLVKAGEVGCIWVKFDRDGTIIKTLPILDREWR